MAENQDDKYKGDSQGVVAHLFFHDAQNDGGYQEEKKADKEGKPFVKTQRTRSPRAFLSTFPFPVMGRRSMNTSFLGIMYSGRNVRSPSFKVSA